jgi:hypothetical protein
MRVSIPQYVKPVASDGHELVMSTPTWYGKHGTHATILVDVRRWPPRIAKHDLLTVAGARFPDGRWACVARGATGWHLDWFDGIHATERSRRDDLPFPASAEDDDAPIEQLLVFGGTLLAFLEDGMVHAHDGERWQLQPLRRENPHEAHTVRYLGGIDALECGALFDPAFQPIDARGCRSFVRAGDVLLALHANQLVEVTATELVPRLGGHDVSTVEIGPGHTVVIAIDRDYERGTTRDHALYDPHADTVTYLPEALVGTSPKIVACAGARALVLYDDKHELVPVSADELGALAQVAGRTLPVAAKIELPIFDDVGASSRPLVATTGDAIAVVLGDTLRFHTVDAPTAVTEHAHALVGVCAARGRFAALDTAGVLHTYASDGVLLGSRPVVDGPRSIAALDRAWGVIGKDRVVIVEDKQTRAFEISGPLAVARDPGGELVIACEDHRLALWTGSELRDLPPTIEQLVAVASLGERKFACLGRRQLYLLDLDNPELTSLAQRLRRPHLASIPSAGRLAGCSSPAWVGTEDLDGDKVVSVPRGSVQYSSYSEPADQQVTVHGLAFMDDGRLVILLDEGRANIVTPETGAALKLDAQPGDARSRWIFISGGQILIAG